MNKLDIHFNPFNECQLLIKDLKASLHGFMIKQNDPANYIEEQYFELKLQVDLRRETLMLEIQTIVKK